MKKRALSMLLALALCFTMFAGIGSAAGVTVDRILTAGSNILDNVAHDADAPADQVKRIDVIKAAAEAVPEVGISTAPWSDLATALIKDAAIDDTDAESPQIYPYFLLRYIADPVNGIDITDKTHVQAAVDKLAEIDAEVNTAGKGINASISMFGPYSDKLTEIVTSIFNAETEEGTAALAELSALGFIAEDGTFTNKETVITYAKTQVLEAVQLVANIVFATTGDELRTAYSDFLGNDIAKKNAALVAGEDLLRAVLDSRTALTPYFKANKDFFKENIIDEYLSKVFDADKAVAVAAVQEAAAKVAEKVQNDSAENAEIGKIAELLSKNLGLTFTEVGKALTDCINALDTEKSLQAVWLDLGINRAIGMYQSDLKTKVTEVANGQPVYFGVYREGLKTRFDIQNAIAVSDKVLVTTDNDSVKAVYADGAWSLNYNEYKCPASVKLHVYRGSSADGADVYRYIETFEVALKAGAKNVEIDETNLLKQYKRGDTLVIKGVADSTKGLDAVVITVKDADGKTYRFDAITPEKFEGEGLEYKIPADAKFGEYTITVGESDETTGVSDTYTFEVIGSEGEKNIQLDKTVLNAEYHRGDSFTIKGVAGTTKNFNAVVVTVVDANGKAYRFDAITPEKFESDGVVYKVPADAEIGKNYTIIVGESDGETAIKDEFTFKVVEETAEDYITIELVPKKASYRRGDEITIKGDTSLEHVIIAIKDTDGNSIVHDVITKEQYAKGYVLKIGSKYEYGDYKVIVGENNLTKEATITVKSSSPGPGGGGSSRYINHDKDAVKDSYAPGESIIIKGTSKGYSKINITVTGPDGTKKELSITPEEFKEGYKLNLAKLGFTKPGKYEINVEGQKYVINYTGVTSDVFNKEDHMAYVIGYEDGTVRPEANISREEVTAILYRLLKDDVRASFQKDSTDAFKDVEAGRWSMASVATLNNIGILKGYEDGTFKPGKAITRAEFAALCSRLASVPAASVDGTYSDVTGHWAENDIYVVSTEGWFKGDDDGKFRPEDNITRAEAITVINRILERDNVTTESFKDFEIVKFSDLKDDAWYYVEVVEATNAHDYTKDDKKAETWKKAEEAAPEKTAE